MKFCFQPFGTSNGQNVLVSKLLYHFERISFQFHHQSFLTAAYFTLAESEDYPRSSLAVISLEAMVCAISDYRVETKQN